MLRVAAPSVWRRGAGEKGEKRERERDGPVAQLHEGGELLERWVVAVIAGDE